MAQFASSDDLAARLGLTLTDDEQTRADTLLQMASGLIQDAVGQQIEEGSDVLVRPSFAGDRVRLKERPVISVESVYLTPPGGDAVLIDPNSYYLDGDELVRLSYKTLSPEFVFGLGQRGWIGPAWTLSVSYTHGFDMIPELVRAVCLEMVVRAWTNPASVAQESIGNVSTLYYYAPSRPTGVLMADTEEKALKALLRRQAGTTTLR